MTALPQFPRPLSAMPFCIFAVISSQESSYNHLTYNILYELLKMTTKIFFQKLLPFSDTIRLQALNKSFS